MNFRCPMILPPRAGLFTMVVMLNFQNLYAQTVVGTISAIVDNPLPSAQANRFNDRVPALSDIRSAFSKLGPLAKWGPISVRPHALFRYTYGDGLLNPTQLERQTSSIYSGTAGAMIEVGRHWVANYNITKVVNSNEFLRDSLDQSFSIEGSIVKDDWTLRFSQNYRYDFPVLAETGQQTRQEYYSTHGSGSYQIGPSTAVEMDGMYSTRLANSGIDTPQWTTADWRSLIGIGRVRYQLSPRLSLGAGIEYTHDDVSQSADMTAVQPNIQISWRPTKKFSLSAQLGSETRRVDGEDISTLRNSVYSASIQYEPIETTSISVSASQSVSASYFSNQASKSRSIGLNFSQRLLGKLYIAGGFTRGETTYIATAFAFITGRKDENTTFNARIGFPVVQRGSVAIFVQRSRNRSNTGLFDYTSDQFGGEIGYRF